MQCARCAGGGGRILWRETSRGHRATADDAMRRSLRREALILIFATLHQGTEFTLCLEIFEREIENVLRLTQLALLCQRLTHRPKQAAQYAVRAGARVRHALAVSYRGSGPPHEPARVSSLHRMPAQPPVELSIGDRTVRPSPQVGRCHHVEMIANHGDDDPRCLAE